LGIWVGCFLVLSAGVGAISDGLPVFCPGLAPGHLPAAGRAGFAGQVAFIAAKGIRLHSAKNSVFSILPAKISAFHPFFQSHGVNMAAKKPAKKPAKKAAKKSVAKSVKRAPAKKAAAAKPAVKPIKTALNKTSLVAHLVDASGVESKSVKAVLAALEATTLAAVSKKGVGEFTLPGLMKVMAQKVPAKPKRFGKNPFTGEEQWFAEKPATVKVKVRALKKLKDAVL
jgi:nucleoid DNA-binding protein